MAYQNCLAQRPLGPCIQLRLAARGSAGSGQVCSPAALRRLPPEAWNDLRCRYSYLGHIYGVRSGWDLPAGAGDRAGYAPAETVPEGHPALADLLSNPRSESTVDCPGDGSLDQPVRFSPGLARYGRRFLSAALAGWWRTWSRKSATPTGPHTELLACWRTGSPLEPVGELRLWLQGIGWDGAAVGREEAGRWLAVWQRERALQRRCALPRAASGPGIWRPPLAVPFATGKGSL